MEGTHDMLYENPFFLVTTGPNRMRSSLTDREIVTVLYNYDFSNCNTISFLIDTQMSIAIITWVGGK